jgi:PKD repeat protein
MKKFYILSLFLMGFLFANAQDWVSVWQDENTTLEQKQIAFNSFYAGKDMSQLKGWKAFKRWEYYYQRHMLQGDNIKAVRERTLNYFLQQSQNTLAHTTSSNGNWSFIGPSQTPTNGGGAGRVNCVEFDASNNTYIGAPAGGLWKQIGTTWSSNTDQLSYMGFSDLLINPTNNNLMYAATGDADALDAPCIGVLKSLDGGTTWVSAGLTNVARIYKIMAFPSDFNKLIAATNIGVFITTNGGTTWNQSVTQAVATLTAYDIEFKPNDPSTIYMVSANNYWVSNDGGLNFLNTGVAAGLPTTGNSRRAIAVTPANPEVVYLLFAKDATNGYGFHSFWRSTNSGVNFTKTLDGATLNLLGWASSGNDISAGGQGWYDLAIAAHPTDANIVYTGGVNVWRTLDGGTNWTLNGHWTGSGGAPYVHADIHALEFKANGELYCGSDGGLFVNTNSTGTPNWSDKSNGLQIAQMYRLGVSQTNDGLVLTGWQDNGTNLRNSSTSNWRRVIGGDGFESAIDPSNANIMLGELYYGAISKSVNGGTSFSGIVNSSGTAGTVNEQGPWLTNFVIAKNNTSVYYVGKSNVYRSATSGTTGSFVASTGIPTTGSIVALAVAPTDENVVYASKGGSMYVSTDGASFTLKNNGLPGSTIQYIAVGANPNTAFVVVSGGAGQKVYKTIDGGNSWTNISGNLPNIAATCIAVDETKPFNQLYVGHDNGVYYKNDTLPNWVTFDNLLPNTDVSELEIMYSANKIKASTYGRGAWESDLFTNDFAPCTSAPTANFSANQTEMCAGANVIYTNASTSCNAATYNWTFAGGTPATSTAVNPTVNYATPGTYNVTLVTTNSNGSNTKILTNYILVKPPTLQTATINANKLNICSDESITFNFIGTNNGTNPTITWLKNNVVVGSGTSTILTNLANGDVIKATVGVGATTLCITNVLVTSNSLNVTVTPQPSKPTITQNIGDLLSSSTTGNQWFNNNTNLTGQVSANLHPVQNGSYTVQVSQNGCLSPMSDPFLLNIEGRNVLFPVPNNGVMNFDIYAPVGVNNIVASLYSQVGQKVVQETKSVVAGLNRVQYKWLNLASGVYNLKVVVGTTTYTKRLIISN